MTQPKREGAPKTETPEEKAETPPEETPRDEDAPLETPENPREWTRAISHEELIEALVPPVKVADEDDEIAELHRHVSQSPVDSHAPVWLPHKPNSP